MLSEQSTPLDEALNELRSNQEAYTQPLNPDDEQFTHKELEEMLKSTAIDPNLLLKNILNYNHRFKDDLPLSKQDVISIINDKRAQTLFKHINPIFTNHNSDKSKFSPKLVVKIIKMSKSFSKKSIAVSTICNALRDTIIPLFDGVLSAEEILKILKKHRNYSDHGLRDFFQNLKELDPLFKLLVAKKFPKKELIKLLSPKNMEKLASDLVDNNQFNEHSISNFFIKKESKIKNCKKLLKLISDNFVQFVDSDSSDDEYSMVSTNSSMNTKKRHRNHKDSKKEKNSSPLLNLPKRKKRKLNENKNDKNNDVMENNIKQENEGSTDFQSQAEIIGIFPIENNYKNNSNNAFASPPDLNSTLNDNIPSIMNDGNTVNTANQQVPQMPSLVIQGTENPLLSYNLSSINNNQNFPQISLLQLLQLNQLQQNLLNVNTINQQRIGQSNNLLYSQLLNTPILINPNFNVTLNPLLGSQPLSNIQNNSTQQLLSRLNSQQQNGNNNLLQSNISITQPGIGTTFNTGQQSNNNQQLNANNNPSGPTNVLDLFNNYFRPN